MIETRDNGREDVYQDEQQTSACGAPRECSGVERPAWPAPDTATDADKADRRLSDPHHMSPPTTSAQSVLDTHTSLTKLDGSLVTEQLPTMNI